MNTESNPIIGILLENPKGMDFSLREYFQCEPMYGIILLASRANKYASQRQFWQSFLLKNHLKNANKEDISLIINEIMDFSQKSAAEDAFQDLTDAIESHNLILLQQAVDDAIRAQIPPSAPKFQEAQRSYCVTLIFCLFLCCFIHVSIETQTSSTKRHVYSVQINCFFLHSQNI